MTFGNPTYFWAFSGILVPIAIHLWSKKEAKTIKIGSIQLLTASDSKRSSRRQLNEIWLLLLRMLIICIVVFILSEPKWKTNTLNVPITYIIEPSLLKNDALIPFMDSLSAASEIRLLKTNLPEWQRDKAPKDSEEIPNYWQLIQEMNRLKTDSIVVFTNAYVQGYKGKRPETTREIKWILLDSENRVKKIVQAVQKDKAIQLLTVETDAKYTSLLSELVPNKEERIRYNATKDSILFTNLGRDQILPIYKENPIKVLLYYSDSLASEKTYIATAFKVLSSYLNRNVDLKIVRELRDTALETFDLIVWLSEERLPEVTHRLLLFKEDEYANRLIVPTTHKNRFQLTTRLTIENSTSKHLAEELLELLDLDANLEKQISKADRRQLALSELKPYKAQRAKNKKQLARFDISKWFWLALLFFLIFERFLANYKKQ